MAFPRRRARWWNNALALLILPLALALPGASLCLMVWLGTPAGAEPELPYWQVMLIGTGCCAATSLPTIVGIAALGFASVLEWLDRWAAEDDAPSSK